MVNFIYLFIFVNLIAEKVKLKANIVIECWQSINYLDSDGIWDQNKSIKYEKLGRKKFNMRIHLLINILIKLDS